MIILLIFPFPGIHYFILIVEVKIYLIFFVTAIVCFIILTYVFPKRGYCFTALPETLFKHRGNSHFIKNQFVKKHKVDKKSG